MSRCYRIRVWGRQRREIDAHVLAHVVIRVSRRLARQRAEIDAARIKAARGRMRRESIVDSIPQPRKPEPDSGAGPGIDG